MYPLQRLSLFSHRIGAVLLTALAGASCRTAGAGSRPPIVQPGAPGEASRVIAAEKAVDLSQVQYTPADVKFMQGMIGHHAQAVEMVALLPVADRAATTCGCSACGSRSRRPTRSR